MVKKIFSIVKEVDKKIPLISVLNPQMFLKNFVIIQITK